MGWRRRSVLLVLGALWALTPTSGWVRLHTPVGLPYAWPAGKLPLSFVLSDAGSDDVPDDSGSHALRRAFAAWSELPAASLELVEDTDPASQARTDWAADDLHLVWFDEDDASGFFPSGVALVAVTPVEYEIGTGKVIDADILFNGSEFTFGTGLEPGRFDVRAVGTHEIGHLVGLGHTAVGGASMSPFTTPGAFAARTLHADDAAGAAALYPGAAQGAITGSVMTLGQPVDGAHVWARDAADGRVVSAGYCVGGVYTLSGLPPGDYVVVAAPLGEPIASADMHSSPAAAGVPGGFDTGFSPASVGPVAVSGSGLAVAPDIALGVDTGLAVTAPVVSIGVRRGESITIDLGVDQAPSVAAVEVPGTGLLLGDVVVLAGNALRLELTALDDAPLGLRDVVLTDGDGRASIWAGHLEVLPEALQLDDAEPSCLTAAGGLQELHGWALDGVAEVRLGDVLATLVAAAHDGTWLQVEWPALPTGAHEIVVMDVAGGQAELPLTVGPGAAPELHAVFPTAGYFGGGTPITLHGAGFDAATQVTVSGYPVTVLDVQPDRITALTPALPWPDLYTIIATHGECVELESQLFGGFTALANPDPVITAVQPALLSLDGGEALSVSGTGFDDTTVLELFADPHDGTGGSVLPTTLAASDRLDAISPAGPLPLGDATLLVRRADGAVAVLEQALTIAPSLGAGVRLHGVLATPEDVDHAFVDGLAGTLLTVTGKRLGQGDLSPWLTVRRADGTPLASTDTGHPAFAPELASGNASTARLKGLLLPDTERYVLDIGASAGQGAYRLTVAEKLPPQARRLKLGKADGVVVGPASHQAGIDAKAGTLLTGKVTGAAASGLRPTLTIHGPDGGLLLGVGDGGVLSGEPDAMAAVTLQAEGRVIRLRKLLLPAFGTYALSFGAAADTSGMLGAALRMKAPRDKQTVVEDP